MKTVTQLPRPSTDRSTPPSRRRYLAPTVVTVWGVAVLGGLGVLARHEATPGAVGQASTAWPGAGTLPLTAGRRTLILFVHPGCPCSAATVDELGRLIGDCGDHVACTVVATSPDAAAVRAAVGTGLCLAASRLPGVTVVVDDTGLLRRRFGAVTSGTAYLYGDDGRLLYVGGLTGSRGHAGDNDGRDAATALAMTARPATAVPVRCPVFGCRLDMDGNGDPTASIDRSLP